jgi:MFS family permease
LMLRFLTGFFLAGIYPVGMKIASDYYQKRLGKSLGFLVGALVIGTAFPHFLKSIIHGLPWKYVIFSTSLLALIGGTSILLLVPDGPYRSVSQKFSFAGFLTGFRNKDFRSVAFGYFGHMWELYAFWTFVPVILAAYNSRFPNTNLNISWLSFLIIGAGSASCIFGGYISQVLGTKKTATIALSISCCCCIISPFILFTHSLVLLLGYLFIWSMAVIADSPLFSTLVAQHAPEQSRGASLTIVNCIGFSITVISIQLINAVRTDANAQYIYMLLAIGPVMGILSLVNNKKLKDNL